MTWSVDPAACMRLEQLGGLVRSLDERGIPVSAPVATRDGRVQVTMPGHPYATSVGVQRVLPGELLDPDDPTEVRVAGAALARLHTALGAPGLSPTTLDPPAGTLPERLDRWLGSDPVPGRSCTGTSAPQASCAATAGWSPASTSRRPGTTAGS